MRQMKFWSLFSLLSYSILSNAAETISSVGSFAPVLGSSSNNYLIKFDQSLSTPFHDQSASVTKSEYSKQFSGGNNLWGIKFLSNYLGLSAQDRLNTYPYHKSVSANIDHELGILAYIGRSFANGHVYLGGGPSLFGAKSNVYDGFVGDSKYVTHDFFNPANTKVAWGGAAQLGMSYYFDPSWYLDLNYTYAVTGNNSSSYTTLASYMSNGPYYVNSTQRYTAQALALSVKKFFSF